MKELLIKKNSERPNVNKVTKEMFNNSVGTTNDDW